MKNAWLKAGLGVLMAVAMTASTLAPGIVRAENTSPDAAGSAETTLTEGDSGIAETTAVEEPETTELEVSDPPQVAEEIGESESLVEIAEESASEVLVNEGEKKDAGETLKDQGALQEEIILEEPADEEGQIAFAFRGWSGKASVSMGDETYTVDIGWQGGITITNPDGSSNFVAYGLNGELLQSNALGGFDKGNVYDTNGNAFVLTGKVGETVTYAAQSTGSNFIDAATVSTGTSAKETGGGNTVSGTLTFGTDTQRLYVHFSDEGDGGSISPALFNHTAVLSEEVGAYILAALNKPGQHTVTIVDKVGYSYAAFGYSDGSDWKTNVFRGENEDNQTAWGFCSQPRKVAPQVGYTYGPDKMIFENDPMVRKILYYGAYGDYWGGQGGTIIKSIYSASHGGAYDANGAYILTHVAISKYTGDPNWAYGANAMLQNDAQAYLNAVASAAAVPNNLGIYHVLSTDYPGHQDWYVIMKEPETPPYLYLVKSVTDGSEGIVKDNLCYSLFGCTYTVYKDAACTQKVGELATGAGGTSNVLYDLELGKTYYYKETTAGQNYNLDSTATTPGSITLVEGRNVIYAKDSPKVDPFQLEIQKVSRVAGAVVPSMAGAQFKISFYGAGHYNTPADVEGVEPMRWWILEVGDNNYAVLDNDHWVGGDGLFKDPDTGRACLPYGTILVEEWKAPDGFDSTPVVVINGEEKGTGPVLLRIDGKGVTIPAYSYTLTDHRLTLADTPDYQLITRLRDEHGDQYHAAEANVVLTDTLEYKNFLGDEGTTVTIKGKLIDKDTGKELATAQTTAKLTGTDGTITMTFPAIDLTELEGHTIYATETIIGADNVERVTHDDPDDEEQQIYVPMIRTTATDKATGEHLSYAAEAERTIVDVVTYSNLQPGTTRRMVGKLMDKETGEPILDASGNEVTAEKEFKVADTGSGTVTLEFTFVAPKTLLGRSLVAFESCKPLGAERDYATHADLEDEDQTVHFPKIGTLAKDSATDIQTPAYGNTITLIDTVSYENVVAGKTYTLIAEVMNKGTGEPLATKDGAPITGTITFTAADTTGSQDVTVTIDMTNLSAALDGADIVFFETLLVNDEPIADHKDLDDEGQTIRFPEGRTTFLDKDSKTHAAEAAKDKTLIDYFYYKNLIVGKEYTVTGTIMIKPEGEEVEPTALKDADGNVVTASVTFTPEEPTGFVEVEFTIDASLLGGKKLVAFETLDHKGVEVLVHADIEDEDQTITIPTGKTKAMDAKTGNQMSFAEEKMTLVDTISYENMIPGMECVAVGTLVDTNGDPILDDEGVEITAEQKFTPEKADGTVDVAFTFSGKSLAGKTGVFFEKVMVNGAVIFRHEDTKDTDQMIYVPKLGTNASLQGTGQKTITTKGQVTIVDKVTYTNLQPGVEYLLTGKIMNKATGKETGITAEATFTPKEANGTTEVVFTFDSSRLAKGQYVVFETCFEKNGKKIVAEHADLKDAAQTVTYSPPGGEPPRTGDDSRIGLLLGIFCAAAGAAVVLMMKRRKVTR